MQLRADLPEAPSSLYQFTAPVYCVMRTGKYPNCTEREENGEIPAAQILLEVVAGMPHNVGCGDKPGTEAETDCDCCLFDATWMDCEQETAWQH